MWENRIKLENYVCHSPARERIQNKLDEMNATDVFIKGLNISTEGGYVYYKVIFGDDTSYKVMDDGTEINYK